METETQQAREAKQNGKQRVRPTTPAKPAEPAGLVGRYFHIWGDDGCINYQGKVVAQIDATHFLVQVQTPEEREREEAAAEPTSSPDS